MCHLRIAPLAKSGDIIQLPRRFEPRTASQLNTPVLLPARPKPAPAAPRLQRPPRPQPLRDQVVSLLPALRAFARSLTRNAADADDLVQDAVTKSLSNLHQFTAGTNFKAWLFTILRNSYLSDQKKRGRRRLSSIDVQDADLGTAAPQPWICASAELREALERLPEGQREALLMIGGMGLSYEEYAEISGCRIGTVKSRLNRARARIAELLDAESANDAV
ncbi:sigma-70 family RNA polymerase sigma factor [Chelatococcus sambhunathii]|uniref:Sigma-70 family RNA polymerase sigma factor n=2 Tax=Chelatococcus sambhunathii TaxID=363953 RepID=A0ABU1DHQ6_9HYPH|nr:sigma-70 family RNA polymerase sigma factor [Chelatococcus sambhunathii]